MTLAQVVTPVDQRWIFNGEDFNLNLLLVLLALQLRDVDLDVDFGIREILLHAEYQPLADLSVRYVRAVLGEFRVWLVLHDLDVLATSLLEVHFKKLSLFDPPLE